MDRKHITVDGAFKRCPDCFVADRVRRLLRGKGYPEEWAHLSLDLVEESTGGSEATRGVRAFLKEYGGSIHLYGPPNSARHAMFAIVLRSVLDRWGRVEVYDSGELARKYFSKDSNSEIHLKMSPMIFTLGRELETKVGSFYFRQCAEHAASRSLPFVLFTDHNERVTAGRYADYKDLADMMKLKSYEISE